VVTIKLDDVLKMEEADDDIALRERRLPGGHFLSNIISIMGEIFNPPMCHRPEQ